MEGSSAVKGTRNAYVCKMVPVLFTHTGKNGLFASRALATAILTPKIFC